MLNFTFGHISHDIAMHRIVCRRDLAGEIASETHRLFHSNFSQIATGQCGNVCGMGSKRIHCFSLCRTNSGERVKVFIAAVLPKWLSANTFRWEFNLCQDEKCVFVTSFTTFGSYGCRPGQGQNTYPVPAMNKENYNMYEADVSKAIIAQGWSLEKPLTAEMTKSSRQCSNMYWNFPEPVVIIAPQKKRSQTQWGKGKVFLNPNEDRSRYGDLLDKYSSVDGRKVTTTPNPEE